MATEIVSAERLTRAKWLISSTAATSYFVPLRLTEETLLAMVQSQDVQLDSSCIVLEAGNPVAFAMLAARGRTRSIGGMGVVATARGRVSAASQCRRCYGARATLGLESVDLEVLEANVWASRLYEVLGFRDVRRLDVLERLPAAAPTASHSATALGVAEALDAHARLYTLRAPWQRAHVVLERAVSMLTAKCVRRDGGLVGGHRVPPGRMNACHCCLGPKAVTARCLAIWSLPCAPSMRTRKVSFSTSLEDDPGREALARAGFEVRFRQREMRVAAPFPEGRLLQPETLMEPIEGVQLRVHPTRVDLPVVSSCRTLTERPYTESSSRSADLSPRGTVMKTPFLALLILGSAISTAHAQVSQEWVARYASPTPYSDVPYAMTVDAAGHVYVTGTTATSTGGNDWATIKYNSAGAQEWLRTLDGGGSDAAFAITTDEAGNVYVTGSSAGGFYFMTAKYSAAGDQLWVQSFTTIGEGDAGVDIALDHEGNVYVTGYNMETSLDIITIKYSPGGAELWVRRYDSGNGEDVPAAIACDASGIYVTGRSGSRLHHDQVRLQRRPAVGAELQRRTRLRCGGSVDRRRGRQSLRHRTEHRVRHQRRLRDDQVRRRGHSAVGPPI